MVSDGHLRPCLDNWGKAALSLMDWDTVYLFITEAFARRDLADSPLQAHGFFGVVWVCLGS